MPVNFPAKLNFGTEVTVVAVLARLVGDATGFRELLRSRGYWAAQNGSTHDPGPWPGAPIPLEWEDAPRGYPLDPDPARITAVRIRRMQGDASVLGVVVGSTYRQEGYLIDSRLVPPARTIPVLEVALAVRSGRARIALVHPRDAQPVQRQRSRS